MKKILSLAIAIMVLSSLLVGCSSTTPLVGKTIETTVASMTVPSDATLLAESDTAKVYSATGNGYEILIYFMTIKGTASTVGNFTDSYYTEYKSEIEASLKNAFSSTDLAGGTFTFANKFEKVTIDGQEAIKLSATVKTDSASGAIDMYVTGNSQDSLIVYFVSAMDTKDASKPAVVNQMLQTIKYK